MAGRGPAPKENPVRTNAPPLPVVELERDKVTPQKLPNRARCHPATRDWWDDWAGSAQAKQFTVTDWRRLKMLALIVDLYHLNPSKDLLAEIRLNEAKLGATPEDRLRLRWKVRDVEGRAAKIRDPEEQKKPSRARKDPRLTLISGGRKR